MIQQQELICPQLPLTVYREIVAHLRQVPGVEAGLLEPCNQAFDYGQSQSGGLWLEYSDSLDSQGRQQIAAILAYYAARFGDWQVLSPRQ
ncbi:MAG: hypothetical protein HC890_12400 [Chloroflexaceae bacterium]|nr:hypothetical protein [Chloroflexaceae bacterium]